MTYSPNFRGNQLSSSLVSSFGTQPRVSVKSSSYAVTISDDTILVDASIAPVTITLLAATNPNIYRIVKIDNSANAVTVMTSGSDTIDGGSTKTLSGHYDSITLASDGVSNWYVSSLVLGGLGSITALTGDVVASGPGSAVATISSNAVSNSKLAQMVNNTVKGNKSGSTANPIDLALSDIVEITSSVLTITNGSKSVIGNSNLTIAVSQSSSISSGYLSNVDWSTFNSKQNALGFTPENAANKGVANGYAGLDSFGKVPYAQLPSALMTFKGAWDASINSPTLADGVGTAGDTYRASVAGTQNLGSGAQTWAVGDFAIYNGTIWQHSPAADGVSSVNGFTGAVTLTQGNLTEATSSVLTISGGTNAVWGSGTSIQVKQAGASLSGYLSSTDWNTFNNKEPALPTVYDQLVTIVVSGGNGSTTINGPTSGPITLPASGSYVGAELQVYLNGQLLFLTSDWNTSGGGPTFTAVTFVDTLQVGDTIHFVKLRNNT